jgi:transposase InsO family protein
LDRRPRALDRLEGACPAWALAPLAPAAAIRASLRVVAPGRAPARRRQEACPLPRARAPGDRRELPSNRGVGYDDLHCVVDDHSRDAYVELHPREDGLTAARVLERALAELAALGLDPPEAVMTDNAFAYRLSGDFQALLAAVGARHITTPPYTPRWNGKVERFIQTLLRECAYVRTWQSSSARARALLSFVRSYNRRRPHGSLGGRPPLSRVHNVRGSYS